MASSETLTRDEIAGAAAQLIAARRGAIVLSKLDERWSPQTVKDAHAIQDEAVAQLKDHVAGWKVGMSPEGELVRGVILASRVYACSPSIPAAHVPMQAVELEVAFRFDRSLEPRDAAYSYEEVVNAVTAFAAIEVVDSRFSSYELAPWFDRAADFLSNGAFVIGGGLSRRSSTELSTLEATVAVNGTVLVSCVGGHPTVDPLIPAVSLVNELRSGTGIRAGQFVTTGSFTGMTKVHRHRRIVGKFQGFGSVELEFV